MHKITETEDINMKKLRLFLCMAIIICSLTACNTQKDYSNQTITGKVTAVKGTKVTLQLGEMTGMQGGQMPGDMQQPSQMPGGDNPNGNNPQMPQSNEQPPEKPDGEDNNPSGGNPPELPGNMQDGMQGGMQQFTATDETATFDLKNTDINMDSVTVDTILILQTGEKNKVMSAMVMNNGMPGGNPGGFGGSNEVVQGTAATTITDDGTYSDTYTSTGDDENALRIDGATVTLENATVDKQSGATSNTENGDFYGVNAGLLATNGAQVTITNATVTTSAQNGNGIFSYGTGTVVNISDTVITTTKDNSGGIQTTGGGTTHATNLTVTTSGNSSAAIRSDRGGGTVVVQNGTYTSNGYNSPAVYSTADITVSDANLTAANSEA